MNARTLWAACALALGCAEVPPEDTGDSGPETTDPPVMEMRFTVDCRTLDPPEVKEISWLPLVEHLHTVEAPFEGYTLRPERPPLDVKMRLRLSNQFLTWAHKRGAQVDMEPDRWTRDVRFDEDGHPLARCQYLATCKSEPCGEDDLWHPDGRPRYEKLVGWIYDPIELVVLEE